ncbi:MAG: PD-(D/E)XK nuclease family protein, partial [Elusimicrobiales bacterium]|nr:PD-(D/E)XK nuclease family protein [Elusimicrobiales bacterium]
GDDITELTIYEQAVKKGREKAGYIQTEVFETPNINEDEIEKEKLLEIIKTASLRYPLNEIAILVAKNKRIEPMVEWLTEAGIPVASLSSLDIRGRKVIAELISLLKFLETPSDDLAFSAFVSGDIFSNLNTGLKKEDIRNLIFEIKQKDRKELLYSNFQDHPKFEKYWNEYFSELFKKVGYLPLYELVSLVYSKFKIFENFKDESAFLSKFLDAVIKLEGSGAGNLRTFIEFAQALDSDKKAVFSIDLPDYVDAVRVMSFHKSKGLGFSVIINMMYEERSDANPMYFKEQNGTINVFRITKEMAEVSPKLKPIYMAKKLDEDIQDLNLLYVISTRAKHELYNLVVKKEVKKKSKETKLIDMFETSKSGQPIKQKDAKESKSLKIKPVDIIAPSQKEDFYDFENLRPTYKSYFETSEGALCHDILSKIIHIGPNTSKELKEHYDMFAPKYNFEFKKNEIIKSLNDFLAMPKIKEYFTDRPGREIKTEAEFIDKTGALRRMDRLVFDNKEIVLIDFKTGIENTEGYKKQMSDYVAILSEVYKDFNIKAVIAYIDLKKIVRIESR